VVLEIRSSKHQERSHSCADALLSEHLADVILDSGSYETFEVRERGA
jgi:hypothetical protein